LGKKHREIFPKGVAYRIKKPLEIVPIDLFGPMRTQSIGGSCYFLNFIDDYNRKSWVYFLKQRSENLAKFKQFKSLVENQSDRQMKVLRSDHGGEYDSKAFHDYRKQHGTRRQFTTWYTQQQNGVVERKKITIMNMERSMLRGRNISNEYWIKAVACVVYVVSGSPKKSLMNRVLEESWSGMSCSKSHLRVFGCVAYAHVLKDLRDKLDEKSEKCIFTSYSE